MNFLNTILTRGRLCSAKPATARTKILLSEARESGGVENLGKCGEGGEVGREGGGGDNKQYLAWLF